MPALPSEEWVWIGLGLSLGLSSVGLIVANSSRANNGQLTKKRVQAAQYALFYGRYWFKVFGVALLGFSLAFSYALYQAHQRLSQQLMAIHEGKVARVQLRVSSIALYTPESIQFDAQILSSMPAGGIPETVRVRWPIELESTNLVRPGQIWQMSLELKSPHS